eukprot:GHVS01105398.1.p1 GENE.GHVS01105398.1~~GHVS01105398.1.p1  ORF type:complete len:344 (+),score=41.77 GHVS01105398.1:215-1246(+)
MESVMDESVLPSWFQNEKFWYSGRGRELAHNCSRGILASSVLYLPLIWALHRIMRHRSPLKMSTFTVLWNLSLSGLSLLGVITLVFGQWRSLLHLNVPETDYLPSTRAAITTFALTKVFEYGDTVVLVLKKKPLTFLHCFHHLLTALYSLHAQLVDASYAHFFAMFNLSIHTVMYFYYAMTAVLSAIPPNKQTDSASVSRSMVMAFQYSMKSVLQSIRPYITISQVVQMFAGLALSTNATLSSSTVPSQRLNAYLATAMYCAFTFLFTHFFITNYITPKKTARMQPSKGAAGSVNDAKLLPAIGESQATGSVSFGAGVVQRSKLSEHQADTLSMERTRMRSAG